MPEQCRHLDVGEAITATPTIDTTVKIVSWILMNRVSISRLPCRGGPYGPAKIGPPPAGGGASPVVTPGLSCGTTGSTGPLTGGSARRRLCGQATRARADFGRLPGGSAFRPGLLGGTGPSGPPGGGGASGRPIGS